MGSNYLTRIAQVDALKLDLEIVDIFKRQIYEIFKYLPAGLSSKYDPEITLFLRLFMFNHSLVKNQSTFGQQLVAIKYDHIPKNKLIIYGFFTHGLNYIKDRIHLLRSDLIPDWNLAKIIDRLEGLVLLASVINFLNFLRSGDKPLLIDRILNLKQVSTVRRFINNNGDSFVTREVLWHTFIELLLIVLPLLNYHSLMRRFHNLNPWKKRVGSVVETREFTFGTKCGHCNEKPILPYHMGCSHLFCFYCLKGNIDADIGYQCPLCNFAGKQCVKFYM